MRLLKNIKIYLMLILFYSFVFTIILGVVSASCGYWLLDIMLNPQHADNFLIKGVARNFYQNKRNTIQLLPECAQYDPDLSYTLKPGSCLFSNIEFDIKVEVNSVGLRDDEESLKGPEVIVLGDSHAMGWGVKQDETFASIIEHKSDLKVLNAAVSSYGTAREMILFNRLDTSNLKFLIIQYSDNDRDENRTLYSNKKLPIMSEESYNHSALEHSTSRDYNLTDSSLYVASYLLNKIIKPIKKIKIYIYKQWQKIQDKNVFASVSTNQESIIIEPDEADLFFKALHSTKVKLNNVHLIILEINGYNNNNPEFVQSLSQKIDTGSYKVDASQMSLLDVSPVLLDKDFFLLDDHMNSDGHKKIADLIINELK